MSQSVAKPRQKQQPKGHAYQRVDIDPECLSLPGPGIMQEAQYTDNDDKQEHDPMKCDGSGTVAPAPWQRKRRFQWINGRHLVSPWKDKISNFSLQFHWKRL
jgi:hypothetical protein